MKAFYVYIMSNNTRTLYTGVTNNLERRVLQHKRKLLPGFTRKYNLDRLVYYETFHDIRAAIQREKQLKGWLRARKVALILRANSAWKDLSEGWYEARHPEPFAPHPKPFACHSERSEESFSVPAQGKIREESPH